MRLQSEYKLSAFLHLDCRLGLHGRHRDKDFSLGDPSSFVETRFPAQSRQTGTLSRLGFSASCGNSSVDGARGANLALAAVAQ
jgi:hypothetical protein